MAQPFTKIPVWVVILCLAMAATQPFAIALTILATPEGAAPTGLHIPDSALFIYAMDMFANGFESAYATCKAAHGTNSIVYYAVPHLWLYGLLGAFTAMTGAGKLLVYGIANGIGVFVYLFAVFRFLQTVVPRRDRIAFILFILSGGFGGLLYLLAQLAGWTESAQFDAIFFRFAIYELAEGPHLLPVTHFPRLYYTLALALGLFALTHYHRANAIQCAGHAFFASILMAAASFIYFRLAVFLVGVVVCYLWAHPFWPLRRRVRMFLMVAVPACVGGGAGAILLSTNPAVAQNHLDVANMAMWFSPFLVTACIHLVLAGLSLRIGLHHLPPLARACAYGAVGYLVAFTGLFVLYQVYYGNILVARDAAVAVKISDPALLGFAVGAFVSYRRKRGFANPDNWIVLWFLGALVVSISAFGQGWFLRFGPQRLELLLWLPLCILAAQGLQLLPGATGKMLLAPLTFLGTLSVCVSVVFFQAPVGRVDARGPYPAWHTEIMHADDAAAIDALGDGTVLALPPASDAIVSRRGIPVVFGIGTFNLTDRLYLEVKDAAETFFDPDTSDDVRQEIARAWCADWIYCSATWPVAHETLDALRAAAWLEEVPNQGEAAVFRVLSGE